MTKYAHVTVPHSGTRYTNEAVERASGIKVVQCGSRQIKPENHEFVFIHIGTRWRDKVHQSVKIAEYPWMTVRNPLATWGTHWKNMEQPIINDTYHWRDKLSQMRKQWAEQHELLKVFPDLFVHRVEYDLELLGDYLGLELPEDNNTFSRPSPMKDAIKNKDLDEMERLCYGTEYLSAFREGITPEIQDLYESWGYDIWWK